MNIINGVMFLVMHLMVSNAGHAVINAEIIGAVTHGFAQRMCNAFMQKLSTFSRLAVVAIWWMYNALMYNNIPMKSP